MKTDKDTTDLMTLTEKVLEYGIHTNKPISQIMNIADQRVMITITRHPKGWNVDIMDMITKERLPATDFLINLVLHKHHKEHQFYQKEQEAENLRARLQKGA